MKAPLFEFGRLWGWPLIIGFASTFGLICALIADGHWNHLGAVCLAVPAAISFWLLMKFLSPSLGRPQ